MPDIDLDFPDRNQILELLKHRAALLPSGKRHNTGIYVTEIPYNPITNISTIDHKQADDRGYFKLDFLNVHIYKDIKDEIHLIELMNQDPIWDLLQFPEFSDQVFHLSGHSAVLRSLKPDSVEKLAACLAIIRPAKRYLISCDWNKIFDEVWVKPNNDQYFFKKSHAVSYAFAVIVHMNLICQQLSSLDVE